MYVSMYAVGYVCIYICNFTGMDNDNNRLVINGFLKLIISGKNVHVGSWDNVFSIKYLESILCFGRGIKLICQKSFEKFVFGWT